MMHTATRSLFFWLALLVGMGAHGVVAADEVADRFAEARQHRLRGRIDEALEVCDKLASLKADASRVAEERALALLERGDRAGARKALEGALAEKEPGSKALAVARLAAIAFEQGDFAETEKRVTEALQLDADNLLAKWTQAELFTATGKLKEAGEAYRGFVRYYNAKQPTDPETLMLVAKGSAQYARWNNVSQIYSFVVNTLCVDALKKEADFWEAHAVSGGLLLEKFNRAQALPELRKALAINPRAARVHTAIAQVQLQQLELVDAEKTAVTALEFHPTLVEALLVRADVRWHDDDLAATRSFLDSALKVNPHDERALARLAMLEIAEEGYPADDVRKAVWAQFGEKPVAVASPSTRFAKLTASLAARNPRAGTFFTVLGEFAESRRKYAFAEKCYQQAIDIMPQLASARSALALLYMRVGKTTDAVALLDKAFTADPFHVRISNMRKVAKLLETYASIETPHFVIRASDAQDKLLAKYMAEYLEEIYPEIVQQFGFEPPQRSQFEIYSGTKSTTAHAWFSARMVGLPWIQTVGASTGMIVALASPTATDKPFNWARVLKHEFVHVVTLQQTDFNIPHWFTEALAVRSEGYPRPESWHTLLRERVPAGDLMTLDNINLGFQRPKRPSDWHMAYCQSELYAELLTKKFGPEAIPKMLEAYRRNLSTRDALKQFGTTQAQFERDYVSFLNQYVAELPPAATASTTEPKLADLEQQHKDKPEDVGVTGRYAWALFKAKKRTEAKELATQLVEKNARDPWGNLVLAELEVRGEDVSAAVKRLAGVLDKEKPHPQLTERLAQLKLKQSEVFEAGELYELLLTLNPNQVEWRKGAAAAFLKAKNTDKLHPHLLKLYDLDTDDPTVRKKLADLALTAGAGADAVRFAKSALHIDVRDAETHALLAKAHTQTKQFDKATAEWKVALELSPDDTELELGWAETDWQADQKEAARTRLANVLKRVPDHPRAKMLSEKWTAK